MAGGILGPIEVVEGIAIGTGVGQAIGDVVTPKLQGFKNERWQKYPDKPLAPGDAALAAVKGIQSALVYVDEAAKSGFDGDVFSVLEQNLRKYPGTGELLELWRRARLSRDEVDLALHRAGIPQSYRDAVLDLFTGRLDPAIVATAIQRGIMRDPGFLPVGPPTAGGKVQRFPVSPLDALTEAKAEGIDELRLFVETALVGLPASNEQAANAYFRGIIELSDYYAAISEGNTRNEWRDAILEQSRQILTANQYAELQLRGFMTAGQRRRNTAKHGMSDTDSDHLFDVLGRSINVHQIVTGEARGGVYKPSPPFTFAEQIEGIPPAFLAALQRGNLRPEYYNLAYANRYTYPSFFAVRGLLTGGVLNADQGDQLLLEMGWKPSLAREVADFYGKSGAKADPNVTKAETQLWSTTHRSYLAEESDDAAAATRFDLLGIPAAAQVQVLALWQSERELIRKQLTPTQIKKAYAKLVTNPETGVAWTRDDAIGELIGRGYTLADAETFLDTPPTR